MDEFSRMEVTRWQRPCCILRLDAGCCKPPMVLPRMASFLAFLCWIQQGGRVLGILLATCQVALQASKHAETRTPQNSQHETSTMAASDSIPRIRSAKQASALTNSPHKIWQCPWNGHLHEITRLTAPTRSFPCEMAPREAARIFVNCVCSLIFKGKKVKDCLPAQIHRKRETSLSSVSKIKMTRPTRRKLCGLV